MTTDHTRPTGQAVYEQAVKQEKVLVDLLVAVSLCLDAGIRPEHIIEHVRRRTEPSDHYEQLKP